MELIRYYLNLINPYMDYAYIVAIIVLLIVLIIILVKLKKLDKKTDEVVNRMDNIKLNTDLAKIKYEAVSNKISNTTNNLVKAYFAFELIKFIAFKKYRNRIKETQKYTKEYERYQKALNNLFN